MGRFGRGWKLAKTSLGMIKEDKEILKFPLLSLILSGIIVAAFMGGIFLMGGFAAFRSPPGIAGLGVMYIATYFVTVYFNAAIMGYAMIKFEEGDPTVSDGFEVSNENLGSIVKWALVAGTVGFIFRLIRRRANIVGKIISFIGEMAWGVATMFVVPVIIYEDSSLIESIKRSAGVLKDTWGETIAGGLGIGLVFLLLGFLGIVPLFFAFLMGGGGVSGLIFGLLVAVPYWLILACFCQAAKSILRVALYRYARTGKISPGFSEEVISNPWGEK